MAVQLSTSLSQVEGVEVIVLDGSVNTGESVLGLSDIDLKVFFSNKEGDAVFSGARQILVEAQAEHNFPINAWFLPMTDHPSRSASTFDFVRSFVLKCGSTLFGAELSGDILLHERTTDKDRWATERAMLDFSVRLRRLATNPTSISDIDSVNGLVVLKQAIAYSVHGLRYFRAAHGEVLCRISDCCNFDDCSFDATMLTPLYDDVVEAREHWPDVKCKDFESASAFLQKSIRALDWMRQNLPQEDEISLKYTNQDGSVLG
ncbi:hypothetical protein [Primorskyibacter sp. S187A]|uniref:hypothetical protein n=1 Tax=Primorskyibacter sp. S187A TaxID=3415130 RepID=UPI003C7A6970